MNGNKNKFRIAHLGGELQVFTPGLGGWFDVMITAFGDGNCGTESVRLPFSPVEMKKLRDYLNTQLPIVELD